MKTAGPKDDFTTGYGPVVPLSHQQTLKRKRTSVFIAQTSARCIRGYMESIIWTDLDLCGMEATTSAQKPWFNVAVHTYLGPRASCLQFVVDERGSSKFSRGLCAHQLNGSHKEPKTWQLKEWYGMQHFLKLEF